jgi:hypothetical protein
VTGDPTTAPELADIVWRDRQDTHWRFRNDGPLRCWRWLNRHPGRWTAVAETDQESIDRLYGPLVAVGHLPAWTGPDDDVEPDDVPTVTE